MARGRAWVDSVVVEGPRMTLSLLQKVGVRSQEPFDMTAQSLHWRHPKDPTSPNKEECL